MYSTVYRHVFSDFLFYFIMSVVGAVPVVPLPLCKQKEVFLCLFLQTLLKRMAAIS